MTIPRARPNPERSIFTQAPVRDDDLAARQSVRFSCPRGHDFTARFAEDASVPTAWECRQHSVIAGRKDATHRHEPVKQRGHWEMLLERRPRAELAQLLDEQLTALRAGQLVSVDQWLAMSNERNNPKKQGPDW